MSDPAANDVREAAQEFLDAHPNDLTGLCSIAAAHLWETAGLRMVFGTYGINRDPHVWNEDADGTIYDLTASQFGHPRGLTVTEPSAARVYYQGLHLSEIPEYIREDSRVK